MNTRPIIIAALAATLPFSTEAANETTGPDTAPPPAQTFLENVFLEGRFTFDLRLRYEYARQSGLDASHAATARTRIGYGTNAALPLAGYIELEDVSALDGSAYNQAGLNNQPQKTVVADPETTELNQAFLRFEREGFLVRLGRQRIVLDNHRFVGNVGWRQNEQTFDAVAVEYSQPDGLAFHYSYIDRVNRVFGREHPMGRWQSDSHLFNLRAPAGDLGNGGAYVYLLEFDEAPAMSGDTFGLWVRPRFPDLSLPTSLHLEVARQERNSGSLGGAGLGHTYFRVEAESTIERFTVGGGWERLEGDGETAFQTPLATLHAFNGWADQFLATPADGLDDFFLFVTAKLPARMAGRIAAHRFSSQRGSTTYGHELDLSLSRPVGPHAGLLAKAALFDGKSGRPDVTKLWLQTEVRF